MWISLFIPEWIISTHPCVIISFSSLDYLCSPLCGLFLFFSVFLSIPVCIICVHSCLLSLFTLCGLSLFIPVRIIFVHSCGILSVNPFVYSLGPTVHALFCIRKCLLQIRCLEVEPNADSDLRHYMDYLRLFLYGLRYLSFLWNKCIFSPCVWASVRHFVWIFCSSTYKLSLSIPVWIRSVHACMDYVSI